MSALYLKDDFGALVDSAANNLSIRSAIVEKDYFVTEALRAITAEYGSDIMFKGGTSLSKGWGLIQRFSEDIDLYINPGGKGENARESLLKGVISVAAEHPAFDGEPEKVGSIKGKARSARLRYDSRRSESGVNPSVLIELGIQSGTFPKETRPITSMLAKQLDDAGNAPEQEDCRPFDVTLLHFRRTFVEKLFALHDKVARGLLQDGTPIGGYARHYYDVSQLISQDQVKSMLDSDEYTEIVTDYHGITSQYYPNQAFPVGLELGQSPALFPTSDILPSLKKDYDVQCEILCYGEYQAFENVLEAFEEIRGFLIQVS